jgi:hypothetical protein
VRWKAVILGVAVHALPFENPRTFVLRVYTTVDIGKGETGMVER